MDTSATHTPEPWSFLFEALEVAVGTIERDRLLWSGFSKQRKDDWDLMLSEMKAALKKARGEAS